MDYIYLDTYVLQQDMRIRLPKAILQNTGAKKGISQFDIYYDYATRNIVLKLADKENGQKKEIIE